ncbi:Piso0_000113 [Millerozyma farinosa CBS 7064]|uniref:Piso0_000113 protein n=1 Tax=Pichia sorbitophila (strain ATCC MYA-4447 / BCRC 22081 / CBS 7064 / NBRC 10061 / NRRL Y-12695) TaxID=559304 RepID=G8YUJ8_PICSO|nr:Piso0_000113 [Millerozyma farinosa CBS 7064]
MCQKSGAVQYCVGALPVTSHVTRSHVRGPRPRDASPRCPHGRGSSGPAAGVGRGTAASLSRRGWLERPVAVKARDCESVRDSKREEGSGG